jgi:regulator of RNase E activity RraA
MLRFDIRELEHFDTPTICNALELIQPERRRFGFTTQGVVSVNADAGPKVGLARTATMRSYGEPPLSGLALKEARIEYYEYMAENSDGPKICVMQDLDGPDAGRGPFWGEFNTRVHLALGFSAIVTDGSVRDVRQLPQEILVLSRGLRPSHGFIHIVDFGSQVNVFGMVVTPGDVVHADEHGAVCFPKELASEVADRAAEFVAGEAPILEACRQGRLSIQALKSLYLARNR